MLIDTHAHINMLSDIDTSIKEAMENNVKKIIVPTASEDDFDDVINLCEKYENLYALIGVHPEDCEKFNDTTAKRMIELLKHKKVKGIGEIGLDYHYTKENIKEQKRCFITQLEIAKMFDKPICIHDRDAHKDVFDILDDMKSQKVLMHCFSGSVELMEEAIKRGYKIALGGVVTFKNAKTIKQVASKAPLEDLMLETDCPFLTPHPFRGEENSPKYIGLIAKEIAKIKNIPYDSIMNVTSKNAQEFFNLD